MIKLKKNVCLLAITLLASIFVTSCPQTEQNTPSPSPKQSDSVKLKSLKIGGANIEVQDVIDLKKTVAEKISVEYEVVPTDATVTFSPTLDGGNWNLGSEIGKKTLTILVKKDSESHTYKLNIEKIKADELLLKKISCETEEKNGDQILSIMSFQDVAKAIVSLKVEAFDPSTTVEFKGFGEAENPTTWEWLLSHGENSLNLKLTKGTSVEEYTIKINSTLPQVQVSYNLNGTAAHNLEDEFDEKALNGKNPLFDAKCNHLLIAFLTTVGVKKITVNGGDVPLPQGAFIKKSEKLYMLQEGEQQFDIFVEPDASIINKYACKHIRFRVKGYANKAKPAPYMSISGNGDLPEDFVSKLEKPEAAPLYKVFKSPAKLEISINAYEKQYFVKEIKIDDVVVPMGSTSYSIEKDIEVTPDNPKPVKIEFVPHNPQICENLIWNFKLQGGGEKPPVFGVTLTSINDVGSVDGELPESLTKHIKDNSNPLYEYDGKGATVVLSVETEEFVKDAVFKMDGADKGTVEPQSEGWSTTLSYKYDIQDNNAHNIEIQVNPKKEDEHVPLVLKFQLKRTGKKIKMSPRPLTFSINGVSSGNMPKEVKDHLFDGTNPVYELDGSDVLAKIVAFDEFMNDRVEHVIFTFANESPKTKAFETKSAGWFDTYEAESTFTLTENKKPYLLKIEVVPKDKEVYESLVYSLNVQSSGKAIPMPLIFGVDNRIQPDGKVLVINAETAEVLVQSKQDVMKTVKIAIKDVDNVDCEVQELQNQQGNTFYDARRTVSLLDGENAVERTIIITVTPKDETKYLPATCTYKLTGRKIEANNAKFVFQGKQPKVGAEVEFKDGVTGTYLDDYGASHVSFTCYTESPRATVRYTVLGLNNTPIDFPETTGQTTEKYKVMTRTENGKHTTEKIKLFTDKPTTLKLWVVAEDGNTVDNEKGVYYLAENPISLRWSYAQKATTAKFEDFETEAYGEITLKKSSIKSDNLVHFAFKVWDDASGGFKVGPAIADGQTALQKLPQTDEEKEALKQSYFTDLDVSKLISGEVQELQLKCNMLSKEGNKDCFTYIVKVKIED